MYKAWDIVYYRQTAGRVPVDGFLAGCPVKVRARLLAVVDDVAEAPPPQFSGGGRWEAMHGTMRGYYEVSVQGPGREPDSRHLAGVSVILADGGRVCCSTLWNPMASASLYALGPNSLRITGE
jgi:hypothetical protein